MPSAWYPPAWRDRRVTSTPGTPEPSSYRHDHRGRIRLPRGPVVVLVDQRAGVCARPASLGERLRSHLHAYELDQALAAGVSPEGQALLALRAQQLAGPAARRDACRSLDRLLAAQPAPGPLHPVPTAHQLERVAASRAELEQLRNALAAPAPLPVRGVAMVHILLTDGGGPLFHAGAREDLRSAVVRAIRELTRSAHSEGDQGL